MTTDQREHINVACEAIRAVVAVFFAIVALFIFSGCAGKEVQYKTIYRDVHVPVPCNVAWPDFPQYIDDPALLSIRIYEYTEELERRFAACRGE